MKKTRSQGAETLFPTGWFNWIILKPTKEKQPLG
jgi:hypothetical protein